MIRIAELEALGKHPRMMLGQFRGDELVYAVTCDGKSWSRERGESAEIFSARIVRDLAERAGLRNAVLAAFR